MDMKNKHLVLLISIFQVFISFSQKRNIIDTISNNNTYFGIMVEFGGFYHKHNGRTKEWIGDSNSPSFSLKFNLNQFVLGFRFLPTTTSPKSNLIFNDEALTEFAALNVLKNNIYVGYSLDFPFKFSLEPNLGLSNTSFNVINQDELGLHFDIPKAKGYFVGGSIHKYFHLDVEKDMNYDFFFSVFSSLNYSWTNFKTVNDRLDNNYIFWGFGVTFTFLF
jgi:hypothetical protein